MSLEAMCPNCAGKGCDECHRTGKRTVRATGPLFTRMCTSCGRQNGALIPRVTDAVPVDGAPVPELCVFCREARLVWKFVGVSGDPS